MSALRPVQADDSITEYFEGLIKQRAPAEVGLLIGKPVVGSRTLLLAVVPSPEQDGQPAVTIAVTATAGSGKTKKGGGAGGGGTGATSVALEAEWVAEHARQVARMLPGGLAVLGLYLLAPDTAWAIASGLLCAALAAIASDTLAAAAAAAAGGGGGTPDAATQQMLVLHINAATGRATARACAAAPAPSPAALRAVELRYGPAAASLVMLTARHVVDVSLPAAAAGRRLQDFADALAAAEAARLTAAVAAVEGALPAPGTALGDMLPPEAGGGGSGGGALPVAKVQLFCSLPSAAVEAPGGIAVPGSAPRALQGECRLAGEVAGVSFAHRRELASRALADLRTDIANSLRARLELLAEEALAAADEAGAEAEAKASGGPGKQLGGAAAAHPLLLSAGAGRAARVALPRRVLLPWRAAGAWLRACDYLAEEEGPAEAAARATELLGLPSGGPGPVAVEEVEAPAPAAAAAVRGGTAARGAAAPLALAKGTAIAASGGCSRAACSSTAVAGLAAGAAALLALAVGYMGLASGR